MDMHTLETYYSHHTPTLQDASDEYAVLIPLLQKADGLHLLYEIRASSLHHHRNEVCFPGGRMEPGETKNLADYELLRYPLGDSYLAAEHISGEDAYAAADIRDKNYMLALERSNLTRFYLDNYLNAYTADARVIAFSTQKEESRFLKNPSEETYGITMLTQTIPVNASRDRSIYRSVLMKKPKVMGGSYDAETNSMSGAEPLTLEYQFGTDIEVESLTFESVSEEFAAAGLSKMCQNNSQEPAAA